MFEHLGYFREYYINDKFIGTLPCDKDREQIGYVGKKKEILADAVLLSNGAKIKANTEVTTMLYPLCGKSTKKLSR